MTAYKTLNKQFIDGQWQDGQGDVLEVKNPFDQEKLLSFKAATKAEVAKAYEAAEKAQPKWAALNPLERRDILEKAAAIVQERTEEIVDWLVKEGGSSQTKAQVEVKQAYEIIREAASFPTRMHGLIVPSTTEGKESRIYRKPLGVIGIISPWNFPFHLSMRSLAPALATGNTVVIKPASYTPVSGATLQAKIFEEAGLPEGVLNVVVGKGSEIGDAFVEHPIPRLISFTGSTEVGQGIGEKAGKLLKKTSLELGGNNVFIVLDDADIEKAAEAATFGKFMHQGQICIAINKILVQEKVHDAFVKKFLQLVKKLKVGNPQDKEVLVGPLIDEGQIEKIQEDLQASLKAGAKMVLEGKVEGSLMHPVVLTEVKADMPIAKKEIFGPVAPIIKFKSDQEAIAIANSTQYGLSGAVFTGNTERGLLLAQKIKTGMVHINDQSVNDEANAAFGGEKASGLGRFGGDFILEEFTTVQWITVQHELRDYPLG